MLLQDLPEESLESNPSEWGIKILLEKNPLIRNLSLKASPLNKEELQIIYQEYKAAERKLLYKEGIEKEKEKEGPPIQKIKKKTKKKQEKKEEIKEEEPLNLEQNEDFQLFCQTLEEKAQNILSNIKTRKKDPFQDLPSNLEPMIPTTIQDPLLEKKDEESIDLINGLRGGKILLQCPGHKTAEIYCNCSIPPQENTNMIACDYCDNWFHFGCVGLGHKTDESAFKEIPYFLCPLCRDWLKFKQKLVKTQRKDPLKIEFLPLEYNIARFRLADSLFLYKLVLSRVLLLLKNPLESPPSQSIKPILETLSILPFKVPKRLEDLKKSKFLSFSFKYLLEHNFMKILDSLQVKSCLSPTGTFLPENHKANSEIKEKLKVLEEFFLQKGVEVLELKQHRKVILLDWILEFHHVFNSNENEKPEFERLSKLKSCEFTKEEDEGFLEIRSLKEKLLTFEDTIKRLQDRLLPKLGKIPKFLLLDKEVNIPGEINKEEFKLKEWDSNEKDFNTFLNQAFQTQNDLLSIRLNSQDLILLQKELSTLEFKWPSLNLMISEEANKLEFFLKTYNSHEIFTGKDLEGLLSQMDELLTQSSEMFELLSLNKAYRLWIHDYETLIQRLKGGSQVSIPELQDLMDKSDKRLDLGENMEFLKGKKQSFEELSRKLQALLEKPMELSVWTRFRKDSSILLQEAHLDEAKAFEDKLKLHKELQQAFSQKKHTIEKLEEALYKAKQANLEEKLIKEIESRLEKAQGLKFEAESLTKKTAFEYGDIGIVSSLLLEIKTQKLELEQTGDLKAILDSFELVEKLTKLWKDYGLIDDVSEGEMNFQVALKRLFDEEKLCKLMKTAISELKALLFLTEGLQVFDKTLKGVLELHRRVLWAHEAKELLDKEGKVCGEGLERLFKGSKGLEIKPEEIEKIENLYGDYIKEKEVLEKRLLEIEKTFEVGECTNNKENFTMEIDIKEPLNEIEKPSAISMEIETKIPLNFPNLLESLENSINNSIFSFEEPPKKLHLFKTWLEWLQKANELLLLLKTNHEIDYEGSYKLLSLGHKLGFPSQNPTYSHLQQLFDISSSFKSKFQSLWAEKRRVFDALKAAKSEGASRKRFFELNRTKPDLTTLQSLLASMQEQTTKESCLFGLLKGEFAELDSELQQANEFLCKYDGFKKSLGESLNNPNGLKSLSGIEFEVLKTEFANYRQESLWNIGLFLKDFDLEFSRLEMQFHGLSILAGLQPAGLVFVKNYLKFADELHLSHTFLEDVRTCFNKAKELNISIEVLRSLQEELQEEGPEGRNRHKGFLKEGELLELMEGVRGSVINLGDNKTFLEGLVSKYKKLKDFEDKYMMKRGGTGRVTHLEYMRFFDEVRLLPLELGDFEYLWDQVKKHEYLGRVLERSKRFLNSEQVPVKIAEGLLGRYEDCRILINEYEKLQEKFQKSFTLMQELERKLALFDDFLPQSFEEHQQLLSKFENINIDFEERTLKVRVLLFKQKVQFLQELRGKGENPKTQFNTNKVSFSQLKHDLQYGYSLLVNEEVIEQLELQIKAMEGLVEEIGEKFREIEELKTVTAIEDYNPVFLNFIDLSEELIEYKMTLTYEKEAKIVVDLGLKHFFQYYKPGGDCIKLLRSMGITPCTKGGVDKEELIRIFAEDKPVYSQSQPKDRPIKKFSYLKDPINDSSKDKSLYKPIEKSSNKLENKHNKGDLLKKDKKTKEKNLLSSKDKTNPLQYENEDLSKPLGKRKVNPTSFGSEFITGFLEGSDSDSQNPLKKLKKEVLTNENLNQKPSMLKSLGLKDIKDPRLKENKDKPVLRVVSDEKRDDLRLKLEKLVRSNPRLKEKSLKPMLQMLENQIFGSYHNNPIKYDTEAQNLVRFFEKLLKYPFISSNLLTKNFRVEIVQKLMTSLEKLPQIEANLKANVESKAKTQTILQKKPIFNPMIGSMLGSEPEKKLKIEQYDPFDKTPARKLKEDPLKELFAIKEKQPLNTEKTPLSLLALTKAQIPQESNDKERLKGLTGKAPKNKRAILEKYEALSSDEDSKPKKREKSEVGSKKEEKKLEFSDDEASFMNDKLGNSTNSGSKKRYSLENSEDSFDNLSKSPGTYDPLTEIRNIEEPILFDPDNEDIPDNQAKLQKEIKTVPKGSLLRIYEGKFRLNHELVINAGFMTVEEMSLLTENFPRIMLKEKGSSLKLSGTTDYKSFSDFYFVR